MRRAHRSLVLTLWLFLAGVLISARCSNELETRPPQSFLQEAWDAYKLTFLHADGFILDPTRNGGEVTSEAQAYGLLRAAWMSDRAAFDKILNWTERHLQRPDGLLSWRWAPTDGGKLLDANTATDGDQDAAFALIVASRQFRNSGYLKKATSLVRAIRQHTRIPVGSGWLPSAGNWAVPDRVINASYFAPYAYPYFAKLDPEGRWMDAADTGYAMLKAARNSGVRLIPDFAAIDETGNLQFLSTESALGKTFSFDAVRLFWRVSLDCKLHAIPRACADPAGVSEIASILSRDGRIVTNYAPDGTPLSESESLTFYAAALSGLENVNPTLAHTVRTTKLQEGDLLSILRSADRYYDLNWIWFGLALHSGWIVSHTPSLEQVHR